MELPNLGDRYKKGKIIRIVSHVDSNCVEYAVYVPRSIWRQHPKWHEEIVWTKSRYVLSTLENWQKWANKAKLLIDKDCDFK